jgi:hypothetical protein
MSTYTELLHTSKSALTTHRELEAMVNEAFGRHPFATALDLPRLEKLLPDYLAMSQGFRYVLAAAQKDAFFDAMSENRGVSDKIEMMNSVANFLMWDETGGCDLNLAESKSKLPELLDLRRLHSELLRADAEKLLGHPITPHFSAATHRYLTALYRGLASTDEVVRCAHMVAFELHAGAMIDSLWASIASVTTVPPDELRYFAMHVGGNDPAELYHVEMTQRLIDRVVPASRRESFRASFLDAYAIHVNWCRALVGQPAPQAERAEGEVWHQGSCHCGGVRFKVRAPTALDVVRCNCSICDMSGFLSLIVPAESFQVVAGEELLTSYQFNTRRATHTFCKVCGLKAFYRPRSHPEGVSVNVRCLDRSTVSGLKVTEFDGQNWEESVRELLRDCA